MYIAKKIKEKSIAEYLLYMWQMEDLIRAYGCSLPRIRKEYIDKFDYTPEQKDEETDWFGNLIRMMNEEGCREKGHLQINQVIIGDLFDLHCQNTTRYCHSSWNCGRRVTKTSMKLRLASTLSMV